ncbi:MAG: LamG domain-containing protein [Planctomycetota bacterium]|nr:LamG domain-containing protein [Planctomycetota bacterium]
MPLLKPPRGTRLNRSHPLARGLVGAWLMNEGGGDKIFDSSRRNNLGTLYSIDWAPGIHGHALKSDAVTDYTDLGNIGVIDAATEITVVAKFMLTSIIGHSDIFVIGTHATSQPLVLFFNDALTDHFGALITDNNNDSTSWKYSAFVPVANVWYHIALVFKGDINTRLYVNGKEDTGGSFPYSNPTVSDIKSNNTYTIGANSGHSSYGARALFDHTLLYRRALSADEIAWLYRQPFAMFERALGGELLYTLAAGIWLAGSAGAQSATSAALKQLRCIDGLASAQSQVSVLLSRTLTLGGSANSAAALSALCKIIRKVSGIATSTSDVVGLLKAILHITASVGGIAAVDGMVSITGEILLIGTATGTTSLHGILTLGARLPWFTSSLEIERQWLREALFNGISANAFKLGTALTAGWFWVRVCGCSALYRGAGMEQIDFTNILAIAAQDARDIRPPSYLLHNSNSTYFYVVRRFNNCGYREYTLSAAVKVSIDADGELARPQPNNIFCSKTEQMDGNKIRLVWFYCPVGQKSKPEHFKIYWDGRTEQIDYASPIATINYQGRKYYNYETIALEAGRYLFAIRAEDAYGIENSSLSQLKIDMCTDTPDSISILRAETI